MTTIPPHAPTAHTAEFAALVDREHWTVRCFWRCSCAPEKWNEAPNAVAAEAAHKSHKLLEQLR